MKTKLDDLIDEVNDATRNMLPEQKIHFYGELIVFLGQATAIAAWRIEKK
jgi:hypothetical protein